MECIRQCTVQCVLPCSNTNIIELQKVIIHLNRRSQISTSNVYLAPQRSDYCSNHLCDQSWLGHSAQVPGHFCAVFNVHQIYFQKYYCLYYRLVSVLRDRMGAHTKARFYNASRVGQHKRWNGFARCFDCRFLKYGRRHFIGDHTNDRLRAPPLIAYHG